MEKRVLLVGWEPSVVDFSKVPQLQLDEAKLRAQLTGDRDRLVALGYEAEWCYLHQKDSDIQTLIDALKTKQYDCVLIGAGVRLPPDYVLVFEQLVNAAHRHAPNAHICFNTNPADTAAAVQRWV